MPCCGCASMTTAPGGGRYRCPRPGSVDAGGCLHAVDVLSDEALVEARSRLNPAAGVMLQRAVGGLHGPAGVDHSPSGRRRGVVANPVGGPQHRLGPASQRAAGSPAGGGDVVCPVGVAAGRARTRRGSRGRRRRRGGRWRRPRRRCRRCNRRWIPMPVPGTCRCRWMSRPPGCCWVRCPRRFMPGCTTFC